MFGRTIMLLLLVLPAIVSSFRLLSSNPIDLADPVSSLIVDDTPDVEERPLCRIGGRCSPHCFCAGKCLVGRFSLHRTCFL